MLGAKGTISPEVGYFQEKNFTNPGLVRNSVQVRPGGGTLGTHMSHVSVS